MDDVSSTGDRRTRRRNTMRQRISNAATMLFLQRGFDAVTIDEIAAAADVARMTVFNHFPRKEDLFFDLDDEGRDIVRAAMQARAPDASPIETLRLLAHRLVAERRPFVEFSDRSQAFIETTRASETLKARARAIRDELASFVAEMLGESAGDGEHDAERRLAASMILTTWTNAFIEAHATFRRTGQTDQANATFLAIIDRGSRGVTAAMAGTPYA